MSYVLTMCGFPSHGVSWMQKSYFRLLRDNQQVFHVVYVCYLCYSTLLYEAIKFKYSECRIATSCGGRPASGSGTRGRRQNLATPYWFLRAPGKCDPGGAALLRDWTHGPPGSPCAGIDAEVGVCRLVACTPGGFARKGGHGFARTTGTSRGTSHPAGCAKFAGKIPDVSGLPSRRPPPGGEAASLLPTPVREPDSAGNDPTGDER